MNPKQEALAEALDHGVVMIHLDATRPDVQVPAAHKAEDHLRLNLSWGFKEHLKLSEAGVEARLSFNGRPFLCEVPWDAIWMITSGKEGRVFQKSTPPGVIARFVATQKAAAAEAAEKAKKRARFSVVK